MCGSKVGGGCRTLSVLVCVILLEFSFQFVSNQFSEHIQKVFLSQFSKGLGLDSMYLGRGCLAARRRRRGGRCSTCSPICRNPWSPMPSGGFPPVSSHYGHISTLKPPNITSDGVRISGQELFRGPQWNGTQIEQPRLSQAFTAWLFSQHPICSLLFTTPHPACNIPPTHPPMRSRCTHLLAHPHRPTHRPTCQSFTYQRTFDPDHSPSAN